MIKYLQPIGNLFIVGFSSKNIDEIRQQYWSFLNLDLIRGDLNFLQESFAYIFISKSNFEKWLWKTSIRIYENNNDIDYKPRLHKKNVKIILEERRKEFVNERFLVY